MRTRRASHASQPNSDAENVTPASLQALSNARIAIGHQPSSQAPGDPAVLLTGNKMRTLRMRILRASQTSHSMSGETNHAPNILQAQMFAVDIEPSDPESDSESATDPDMPELIPVELSPPPSPRPVRLSTRPTQPTCDRDEELRELGPTLARNVSPRPTRAHARPRRGAPGAGADAGPRGPGPRWDLAR